MKDLLLGWQAEQQDAPTLQGVEQPDSDVISTDGRLKAYDLQRVLARLARVDPLHTTPIDALVLLAELKKLAEGGGSPDSG